LPTTIIQSTQVFYLIHLTVEILESQFLLNIIRQGKDAAFIKSLKSKSPLL